MSDPVNSDTGLGIILLIFVVAFLVIMCNNKNKENFYSPSNCVTPNKCNMIYEKCMKDGKPNIYCGNMKLKCCSNIPPFGGNPLACSDKDYCDDEKDVCLDRIVANTYPHLKSNSGKLCGVQHEACCGSQRENFGVIPACERRYICDQEYEQCIKEGISERKCMIERHSCCGFLSKL